MKVEQKRVWGEILTGGVKVEEFENFSMVVNLNSKGEISKLNKFFEEGWSMRSICPLSEDRVFVVLQIPLEEEEEDVWGSLNADEWANKQHWED